MELTYRASAKLATKYLASFDSFAGDNHHVHDIEVTNRDECVTVKVRLTKLHLFFDFNFMFSPQPPISSLNSVSSRSLKLVLS